MKSALGARWPLAMYTSPPEVGDGDVDHGVDHGDVDHDVDHGDDDDGNDDDHGDCKMASCYVHISTCMLQMIKYSVFMILVIFAPQTRFFGLKLRTREISLCQGCRPHQPCHHLKIICNIVKHYHHQ